ncbi:MAG TPA: hypothetical protein VD861_19945, partial [Pyrinomonadaceae bacterium]|nr:hypothetical protein [Pyrinomonadaceae bacterium]
MTEFAELFGHISDPAVVVDEAGGLVHACNEAFAALALRPCDSVVGAEVSSVVKFEDGGGARRGHAHATVLVNGEHPLRVGVERVECHWEERP